MYYKVVNSDMSSAYVGSGFIQDNDKVKVFYKINQWVNPKIKGTKLMVFNSLENAEKFRDRGWGEDIYQCQVKNPSVKGIFIRGDYNLVNNLLKIINLRSKKKKFTNLLYTPRFEGTIFCDAVKLIEKV